MSEKDVASPCGLQPSFSLCGSHLEPFVGLQQCLLHPDGRVAQTTDKKSDRASLRFRGEISDSAATPGRRVCNHKLHGIAYM